MKGSRVARALALAGAAALSLFACKSPEEPATSDASFTPTTSTASASATPPASASATASASSTATPLPPDQPGKYPEVDRFCASTYGADLEAARAHCSADDWAAQETVVRMATRLCRHDLELLTDRASWKLDAAAADGCAKALKGATQTEVKLHEGETFFLRAPCDKTTVGLRGEGQACRFPPECKDGLACDGYKVGVDGKCVKPGKVGASCSVQAYGTVFSELSLAAHHAPCVKGAYCNSSGVCAARGKIGDACSSHLGCDAGAWCVAGRCKKEPFAADGATCKKSEDCAFGLFCDDAADAASDGGSGDAAAVHERGGGRCRPKRAAGEVCTGDQCKGWCDIPPKKKPAVGVCRASCGSG